MNSALAIDFFRKGTSTMCSASSKKNETVNLVVASSCHCTIKPRSHKYTLNPQCFIQFIVVMNLPDVQNLAQILNIVEFSFQEDLIYKRQKETIGTL